jgi:Na+-transporting methylmalonyl-CoA/oxaloacetate decarboxylase gamma subunit
VTVSIEWFRDLVICMFGLGATLVVLFLAVLALLVYLRVRPILDSVKKTTKTVENISSCVEQEVAKPLAQVVSLIQGIRQAFGMVSRFSKKKGDD